MEVLLSIISGIFALIVILSVVAFVVFTSCLINALIGWRHSNKNNKKNM